MLALRWSGKAKNDLAQLLAYIALDNATAAAGLQDQISRSIETARHFPQGFRLGRVPGTREIVAHPNYIVVYQVMDDRIDIVSVLHARQQYP